MAPLGWAVVMASMQNSADMVEIDRGKLSLRQNVAEPNLMTGV
jgi:hypothetical protein